MHIVMREGELTYLIWCIRGLDSASFEQKSRGTWVFALPFAECLHEFLQLCAPLNLEEDFIISVSYFDIEMLAASSGSSGLSRGTVR